MTSYFVPIDPPRKGTFYPRSGVRIPCLIHAYTNGWADIQYQARGHLWTMMMRAKSHGTKKPKRGPLVIWDRCEWVPRGFVREKGSM